jgi:hypothetical protein
VIVPPLTAFKSKKKTDDAFIKKRGRAIHKFMNCLMRSDELKANMFLVTFLSSNDKKLYDTQKSQVKKILEPKRLEDVITIPG